MNRAGISSEDFTEPTINRPIYYQTSLRFVSHTDGSLETLRKILKRLAGMDLPGKDHVEAYLRHLTRGNRKPRTLDCRWCTILTFLGMIRDSGKICLEEITRTDVEAFIEHEQDRGHQDYDNQDEAHGCSVLSPLSGGR